MAGSSMTFTYDPGPGPIVRVVADWTSDDSAGTASGTTTVKVIGKLIKAVTDPGSAAPTDNYDITISDDEGVDVLAACQSTLANRHTTTTQQAYFLLLDAAGTPLAQSVHPVVCGPLTLAVANAGNSKTGQIILYVEGTLSGSF